MDFGSAVAGSEVTRDTVYLPEGNYLVQIDNLSWNGEKGLFFANVDILQAAEWSGAKPGQSASICVNCKKYNGSYAGNVKKILSAATREPVEEFEDPKALNACMSSAQPLQGMVFRVQAQDKDKKNSEGKFTLYKYESATDTEIDSAAELREQVGLAPLN